MLNVGVCSPVCSNHNAYNLILILSIFPTIPLGLIGLGATPGFMTPEALAPPKKQLTEAERQKSVLVKAKETLADFVSAYQFPPFRWLFITNVANCCYGTIANLFFIYW